MSVAASARRLDPLTATVVLVVGGAILVPLFSAQYPPIIDLPFHASVCAIFRHLHDPAWHFDEQLTTQLFAVPTTTLYALGAALALVLPIATATKLAAALLLAALPAGLSVLLRALGKSPLLAVLSTPLAWTTLSHWGFYSYLGAVGFAMASLGMALHVLARPTVARRLALAVLLVVTLETHVSRHPTAAAAVLAMSIAAPRWRQGLAVLAPSLVPSAARFGAWLAFGKSGAMPALARPDLGRLREIPGIFAGGFVGDLGRAERAAWLSAVGLVAAIAIASFALTRRDAPAASDRPRLQRRGRIVVGCIALGSLASFLSMPMSVGDWWYVYPREIVVVALLGLALLPDLPASPGARRALVLVACLPALLVAGVVLRGYSDFEAETADFRRILRAIPQAPRLSYVVFDREGGRRATSPYVHLPAWVQAERGGWLSFHFATAGWTVVRYRDDSTAIPPAAPDRIEWAPTRYTLAAGGGFFDTFLVRSHVSPDPLFAGDPSIAFVQHSGAWWLYRRGAPR